MGVQNFEGKGPKKSDVKIGKNYLTEIELYKIHLLSEQFLLYAESTAIRSKKMTMAILHDKLDRLMELNEYAVFDGWKNFNRDIAVKHAEEELRLYNTRKKVESRGIKFDTEAFAFGDYDETLAQL